MAKNTDDRASSDQEEPEKREPNTLLHEDEAFRYGFTQIPNLVLYARNLSAQAKTLYAILLSYSWKADRCFPGYTTLCEHMGLGRDMVRKYMKELEAVKLLHQKRRGLGLTNIYTLLSLKNALLKTDEADDDSTRHPENDPSRHVNDGQTRTKKDEGSKKTKSEEDTDSFRKGRALKTQEGRGGETSKETYSHREQGTIGNEQITRESQSAKGEALNAVLTTNTSHRKQGKEQAGIEQIGVTLEHMDTLNRQYRDNPADQTGNKSAPATQQGNWKKAPLFIQGAIGDWFSPEMHDQATTSTITRVYRIYQQWAQSQPELTYEQLQDEFYQLMQEARTKSKYATIKTLTPTGHPNRTPFFLACLANLSGIHQDG